MGSLHRPDKRRTDAGVVAFVRESFMGSLRIEKIYFKQVTSPDERSSCIRAGGGFLDVHFVRWILFS